MPQHDTTEDTLEDWKQCAAVEADARREALAMCRELCGENARLRATLADIAKQKLPAEIEGWDDSPDYLTAYEEIVARAREALA